jgi:hypothetical protein
VQAFPQLFGQIREMPAKMQFLRAIRGQLAAIQPKLLHNCRLSPTSGSKRKKLMQKCSFLCLRDGNACCDLIGNAFFELYQGGAVRLCGFTYCLQPGYLPAVENVKLCGILYMLTTNN